MSVMTLIEQYVQGPQQLREALQGMSAAEIDAAPIASQWSTRQVVCHIADFEPVYADRMKRVIAEDNPPLRGGDPDVFAAKLAYAERNIEEELQLIECVRRHVATILKTIPETDFQRTGLHSADGPLTLETLLKRITGHIPHHISFIEAKKQALRGQQ